MPSWMQHSKEKCEGKSDGKSKQEGMKLPYVSLRNCKTTIVIFLKDHLFHKSITKPVKPDRQLRLCQRADELPEGKAQSTSGKAITSYDRNKGSRTTGLQFKFSIVTLQSECLDVKGDGKCGERDFPNDIGAHREAHKSRSTCRSQCLEHKISSTIISTAIPKYLSDKRSGTTLVLSHDLCLPYPPSQKRFLFQIVQ